ncbi:MAG TPA: sensor histidine kinase, partial [Pyrinomonadaceae bacterium]|nr:sensor histidine kinase [Pyrinomonadaceae bacterium]
VKFKSPNVFEEYRWYIIGLVGAIIVEGLLIGGLIVVQIRRREAETINLQLSGRLINAQEEERVRLARELHDNVSQMLALFSIELEIFKRGLPDNVVAEPLDKLSGRVKDLSEDIHRISHELHPATLHQLGFVSAARSFCAHFGTANGIDVEFEEIGVPDMLPDDVSVCIYRIIQESLTNVVKHSEATSARVEVTMDKGELRLVVSDAGVGFDPHEAAAKRSLGLTSIRERIRLVNGKLSIQSHPGSGTRIIATVPVDTRSSGSPLPQQHRA